MPSQHITVEETPQTPGIVVPLELEGLRILRQEGQVDGKLRVEVIATKKGEQCPHCGTRCVKQHDVRPRRKRDVPLRGHVVELVLHKRRFWCLGCAPCLHRKR
jgi:transposase